MSRLRNREAGAMTVVSRTTLLMLAALLTRASADDRPAPATASAPAPEPTAAEVRAQEFREFVRPLLDRSCASCHGQNEPKAGLNLAVYATDADVTADPDTWERIAEAVEGGTMPPSRSESPVSEEESERFVAWVESALTSGLCEGPVDPGHVTLRRLNRVEYDHTVRDLLHVDFHPAEDFPSDDVGYGFDNIGDVLTLSPLLLERYLNAAEQVASRAILLDRTDYGSTFVWRPADLRGDGDPRGGDERILNTNGEIRFDQEIGRPGRYRLTVGAYQHVGGDELARMVVNVNGQAVAIATVEAREDDPALYAYDIDLEPGRVDLGIAFDNDFNDETLPRRKRDRNLIVTRIQLQGPIVPGGATLPESHRRLLTREPADPRNRDEVHAAAREVLGPFMTRAFRRPVRPEEIERLLPLVDLGMADTGDFARGIQAAVTGVLVSPHFLFRVELAPEAVAGGAAAAPGPRALDDYELASRLSYFLWSSMPDETLFQLAAEGRLHEESVLVEQAGRMLDDPKMAGGLVENFALQWLQLRTLSSFVADGSLFPAFDEALRSDMLEETRQTIAHAIREDWPIVEWLDARHVYVNERMARLYGIEGVTGSVFRRVELPEVSPRGGLLTQASVLAATSNPTRTSPVKRGKWILEAILGTPPPPAPPGVPALSEEKEAILSGSLRERMERHRSDPACASCHQKMDTLGFGFENFDPIGAWREKDGEFAVDPAGTLPGGRTFGTPAELKRILVEQADSVARALAEKLLTYALGRGLEPSDRCVTDQVAAAGPASGLTFRMLVTEVVRSTPFRYTRDPSETEPVAAVASEGAQP
jgi:mono/diheme cytochrome c family protein